MKDQRKRPAAERKAVKELTEAQCEFAQMLGHLLAQRWQNEQAIGHSNPTAVEDVEKESE